MDNLQRKKKSLCLLQNRYRLFRHYGISIPQKHVYESLRYRAQSNRIQHIFTEKKLFFKLSRNLLQKIYRGGWDNWYNWHCLAGSWTFSLLLLSLNFTLGWNFVPHSQKKHSEEKISSECLSLLGSKNLLVWDERLLISWWTYWLWWFIPGQCVTFL